MRCKDCAYCSGDIIKKEKQADIIILFNCNRRPIFDRLVEQVRVPQIKTKVPLESYPMVDCEFHTSLNITKLVTSPESVISSTKSPTEN